MDYFKIPTDFLDICEPLDDAEIGRLFAAMLKYAKDGTEPRLPGNERFLWATARREIDRSGVTWHIPSGEKHWNWKGGITPQNQRERSGKKYNEWRTAVFVRDNFTCQSCGRHGGDLNAHHIEPWSTAKELRFDVDNGITLCRECHRLIHKGE